MIPLLLRLYPARWRARYGEEFAVVLAERPLGPFDVADIVLGAIDARMNLRGVGAASEHGRGFAMSLRVGGYAAILGGILWLLVLAGNAINNGGEAGGAALGILILGATVMTLVALVGLSAFQSRRHARVVWAAFAIPASGAVVMLAGTVAMALTGNSDAEVVLGLSGWAVATVGVMTLLLGSGLFAAATWLANTLSRPAAAVLGLGAAVVIPAMSLLPELLPSLPGYLLLAAMIVVFPAGWIGLGVSALRVTRPSLAPGAV